MVLAASSMPPGAVTLMGDSQTTTSQGYGGKFATMFSSVIVDNESMGGQTTAQISARYGGVGITCTVASNTIPTSGSVTITNTTPDPFYHWSTTYGSMTGTIGGVAGILSWTASVETFTPTVYPGSPVTVSNPVAFIPTSGIDTTSVNALNVTPLSVMQARTTIFMGGHNDIYYGFITGGSPFAYNQTQTLANIAAAAAACTSGRFIVSTVLNGEAWLTSARSTVGLSPSDAVSEAALTAMNSLNAAIIAAGYTVVDTMQYLLNTGQYNGWLLGGFTYNIINQTVMPDGTHFTGTGWQANVATNFGFGRQNFLLGTPTTIAPNNSAISVTDFCGTLTQNSTTAFITRPNIGANGYLYCPTGSRIRFVTNSPTLVFNFNYTNLMTRSDVYNDQINVLCNGVVINTFVSPVGFGVTSQLCATVNLPGGTNNIDVILCYGASIALTSVSYNSAYTLTSASVRPSTQYLAMGESVTQGYDGTDSTQSYDYLLALNKNWTLLNAGYGGETCVPSDATAICAATSGVNVATYLCGYNDWVAQTSLVTFTANYQSFVTNFRTTYPSVKLYCITWLYTTSVTGPITIGQYRTAIATALTNLNNPLNILVNGLTLMTNDQSYLFSNPHPNNTGMAQIATNLAPTVIP